MKILAKITIALLLAVTLGGIASAQEGSARAPVTLSGEVLLVKVSTGTDGQQETELVPPDLVVPGDRLLFRTHYANTGSEEVTAFVVTSALPAAVRLAPDADADLIVSVDGGQTWGTLPELTVTAGDSSERPATTEDVTHLRWTLASIAVGATGRLEYPAIIR